MVLKVRGAGLDSVEVDVLARLAEFREDVGAMMVPLALGSVIYQSGENELC